MIDFVVVKPCRLTPVGSAPAPPGWRAVYRVGDGHVVLPVAFWMVHSCEHGLSGVTMVVPASGIAIEVSNVTFEDRVSSFVAVIPPGADVERVVQSLRGDLRSVAQA